MALSAQKAHQINILLPPVNAPALILRLGQDLAIPQVHHTKASCRDSVCRSCVQEFLHTYDSVCLGKLQSKSQMTPQLIQ